jgi:hypothetical protein
VTRDLEQWYVSGSGSTCEDHGPIFQGENPGSGLNWLCLTMTLLKVLF